MRSRPTFWIVICLLLAIASAWFFWPHNHSAHQKFAAQNKIIAQLPTAARMQSAGTAPKNLFVTATNHLSTSSWTNPFPYRLSNTTKSIGQLVNDPQAILLENALIDTGAKINLNIPKKLQAPAEPGAYIVQSRGPINNLFREVLASSGAQIISYIPNDAYLVRVSSGGASALADNSLVQTVLPYEPYYKMSPQLLALVMQDKSMPLNSALKISVFPGAEGAMENTLQKAGADILAEESSSLGTIFTLQKMDPVTLAQNSTVHIVQLAYQRAAANDLARVTLGISTDTVTNTDYMNLYGSNVMVEVNDSGIDAMHPDFSYGGSAENPGNTPPSRVTGDSALSILDANGHGTHVAGVIAGNGSKSYTVTNAEGSATNADFRGKAPDANLFSVAFLDLNGNSLGVPDQYLQETPAKTNALISNNSWNYTDDSEYDLSAASYDAAVRDALTGVTGSQPVLFVFSAGNDGGGDDDGGGGSPDTILSPATGKNVITVGALEQLRNITNVVTALDGSSNSIFQPGTDSGFQVASYSSRGNVGIGTEGTFGRFKPDVVAPGTFVISTRSGQWNEAAYYNPTNYYFNQYTEQVVNTNSLSYYNISVPINAVGVLIQVVPNEFSTFPFPTNLPIYVSTNTFPDPTNSSTYDFVTTDDQVSIPSDGGSGYLNSIQNGGFYFAVGSGTNTSVSYDVLTEIITTNDLGNYFQVLSNLNDSIGSGSPPYTGGYYRYESGTSIAAPAISGVLALFQDYFTNTLKTSPSPALLKALLVNGARPTANYPYGVTNSINLEGWGLANLPNSLALGLTNQFNATCSEFFLDQNPTNALATGDSHTFNVALTNSAALSLPLRVTLVWTDPAGDPSAAIKLVNNLDLMVSNNVTGQVYFGNNFGSGVPPYSVASATNTSPNLDSINNVENIFLPPLLGANYSITVIGRNVNVNAVTAQTNNFYNSTTTYAPNIVQDFALVIACGEGEVTNAIIVTDGGITSTPTTGQQITDITSTNSPLLNQFVGASSPLLGTNATSAFSTNALYATNSILTIGQTNQWHFYVVTNNGLDSGSSSADVTNAAFVTFFPNTLSIPRLGVFADSVANATRPEADIDMFVTTDPNLTNLSPVTISNCVQGVQVGRSIGGIFNGVSLGRGGTEFVVDTNSTPGQVYYVGVQSEDQNASEYGFLSVFTATPFSQLLPNGDQLINGISLPQINVPDGSPAHPGTTNVFALALYPMEINSLQVTTTIQHQNYGDLIGVLNHNGTSVVLNNHDSLGNPPGPYTITYNDSGEGTLTNTPSDGPGSLKNFTGEEGIGPYILTETDDALTQTGAVQGLSLLVEPHKPLQNGVIIFVEPFSWSYYYIDVPVGYYNLTIASTNISVEYGFSLATPPVEMFVKYEALPTAADTNGVFLTNSLTGALYPTGPDPGNAISTGPPLQPGRYFLGLFNNSPTEQVITNTAYLPFNSAAISTVDYKSSGPTNILDDAVTYSTINVTNFDTIQDFNVGIRVDHPRISDLVFHLISPDGTRYLLMENRGGTSTNGAGATIYTTNFVNVSANGNGAPQTNYIDTGEISGTAPIIYNFHPVPDEMTIYYGTNVTATNLILDTGFINNPDDKDKTLTVTFAPTNNEVSTILTIVMNQFGNPSGTTGTRWNYSFGGIQTNNFYLSFTEDTNLTTTPIKFAPTLVPTVTITIDYGTNFDSTSVGTYINGNPVSGGIVLTNQVAVTNSPPGNSPPNSLAIENGAVQFNLPTITGQKYFLSYALGSFISESTTNASTNANFQIRSLTFTASSASTPFILNASGSSNFIPVNAQVITLDTNALIDDVLLTRQAGSLYYLPEQDMSGLNGESAFGNWTLEILDNWAGATNPAPTLDSWQLEFTFANTNFIPVPPPVPLTNGATNIVEANSINWFIVNVPTNADFATNILIFATAPVNLLFNQNSPNTNGTYYTLLTNSVNGTNVIGLSTVPPLIPGSTYYLGVQNTNNFAVTNAIAVFFHLLTNSLSSFAFTQPATLITGTSAQLNGMATPNGFPATAWFQWGTNTGYGNQTVPVGVGNGFNVIYVTNQIPLIRNLSYHFRLVVSNAFTVTYGFDQILDEANVAAWGANYEGQLDVPAGLSNVVAIAGAYDHSLALKNDGTAAAWGDNLYGQSTVPAVLNANLVALAGGETFSVALKNSGLVVAWGGDIYPGAGETNVPTGLNNVIMISSGQYSSLALQTDGTVVAWGANLFNPTNIPAGLSNVVAIGVGSLHNLAIKNDGTVVAWGNNGVGQTNVPAGLSNVVAIAAGDYHNLALKNDGTVVAWGYNNDGQTNVPAGLSNVVAVAAGGFHSLALKADGSITTWGDNSAGQYNVPAGLSNFVAISCGYLHSLALTPQSVVNFTNTVSNPTNGMPQTNTILPGSVTFYSILVPTNADFATNRLLFANGPLNIWFSTNIPPTIGASNDTLLLAGVTNASSVLSLTSVPTNIIPGSTYYLGVQNTNSFSVNYGIEVDFHLITNSLSFTNTGSIYSIIQTNINGINGFLLTWFAPSNDVFQVQYTTNLIPANWISFTNIITYNTNFPASATNAQFNFFDDGSQTSGFDTTRFYRLILIGSSSGPANGVPGLTNGVPQTNSVATNAITYFSVNVPTNADFATNILVVASAPVNLLFNQTNPPTGTNTGNFTLLTNASSGIAILSLTSAPPLVPGSIYYLGVQNTNNVAVTFTVQVNFHLTTNASTGTNVYPISSIVNTTNGFLLTWFAPTNDSFQVQYKNSLIGSWSAFTNIVTYNTNFLTNPTNTQFNFLDDGSQTGGLPSMRFYRLILISGGTTAGSPSLTLPTQPDRTIVYPSTLMVTNTATDSNTNAVLTYILTNAPAGAMISTNGIITWTPPTNSIGTNYTFTTIVTESNSMPALSATNSFKVYVISAMSFSISSVTLTNGHFLLTGIVPTNDTFYVQSTTNLTMPAWINLSNLLTSTNGFFSFLDTNAPLMMEFYRLKLFP